MKNSYLIFTFLLFMIGVAAKATNPNEKTNPNSETSTNTSEVKSNVVIFKIIPAQSTNENSTSTSSNNSGSLKKAGKVARTSYCHTQSLENIIYKKKGI